MNELTKIVGVDVETTGLDASVHQVWEVAAIVRWVNSDLAPITHDGENEHVWQLPIEMHRADPEALEIGRFADRRWSTDRITSTWDFAVEFQMLTAGAFLVGAVPSFDAGFLAAILRRSHLEPKWKHRLLCVETYFAGAHAALPSGLRSAAEYFGLRIDDHHTALGDARLALGVFDGVRADYRAGPGARGPLARKASGLA